MKANAWYARPGATGAANSNHASPTDVLDALIADFSEAIASPFSPSPELHAQCVWALENVDCQRILPPVTRVEGIFRSINNKLNLHRSALSNLYAFAAKQKIVFNYHDKLAIRASFDSDSLDAFTSALRKKDLASPWIDSLLAYFAPLSAADTLQCFKRECQNTINPRSKVEDSALTPKMVEAIFAEYLFRSFELEAMHAVFDPGPGPYIDSFWDLLHHRAGHLFDRKNALWIARFGQGEFDAAGTYDKLRDHALSLVAEAYDTLDNHGTLALSIGTLALAGRDFSWELAADLTLFAEKFAEERLTKSYFQKEIIEDTTKAYIAPLSLEAAHFEIANGGFTYLDCFVVEGDQGDSPNLLLIFQKHKRDETPIPCPSCRSHRVEGNSYPVLGVRSWECQNLICPDRSKSNRGKRYSFLSLLKQQAADDLSSEIPISSVRKWQKDVVRASVDDTIEMVIRHFSIAGDGVVLFGLNSSMDSLARDVRENKVRLRYDKTFSRFVSSAFFARFLSHRPRGRGGRVVHRGDATFRVLQGDVHDALQTLADDSLDAAITSPPYYNARDYARWDNIYCYMYDMFNVANEVFRVLKPGSLFLYNIFNYFDNENSITFSAMGQKRIPLSAYSVYAFRAAGFEPLSNIVWDKGDIEGKRGFNGGNFSPYYQSPFNCWEHIPIFAKPGKEAAKRLRLCRS